MTTPKDADARKDVMYTEDEYIRGIDGAFAKGEQARQPEIEALKAEVERLRKDAERHQYLKEMEKMFRYEAHYNGTRSISEVYEMIRLNACAAMADKGE